MFVLRDSWDMFVPRDSWDMFVPRDSWDMFVPRDSWDMFVPRDSWDMFCFAYKPAQCLLLKKSHHFGIAPYLRNLYSCSAILQSV
jgi:hypothetical protein